VIDAEKLGDALGLERVPHDELVVVLGKILPLSGPCHKFARSRGELELGLVGG
jgi:hypothetical protein